MTATLCVVQARMGSTRFPGKVVAALDGRPLLEFMLARLLVLPADNLVVATSTAPADDAVAELAGHLGVPTVRGPELDVLQRFLIALDQYPAATVVRLTADCPLADPELVAEALALHRAQSAMYTSNSLIRTYPDGLDVEVIDASALREAAAAATDPEEREHVTPYVYRRPGRYRLAALRTPELLGEERWTVDTPHDLDRVRDIVERLPDPTRAGWRAVLETAGRSVRAAAGALWLRPALETDDLPVPAGDPGARCWAVVRDAQVNGWVQVVVDDGRGTVRGAVTGATGDEVMAELQKALRSDFQVRELDTREWMSDG